MEAAHRRDLKSGTPGRSGLYALAAVLLLVEACRARSPETRIVVVTATPAPVVAVAAVALPTPEPPLQSAEFSFPVPAPTEAPPTPLPAAPVADEPVRQPVAESVRDQLSRCVTFTTERFHGETLMYVAVLAKVRATNVCNESFPGQNVWIEVRVVYAGGGKSGVAGSQISRFSGNGPDGRRVMEIPTRGSAELLVLVNVADQHELYRYETALSSKDDQGRPAYD